MRNDGIEGGDSGGKSEAGICRRNHKIILIFMSACPPSKTKQNKNKKPKKKTNLKKKKKTREKNPKKQQQNKQKYKLELETSPSLMKYGRKERFVQGSQGNVHSGAKDGYVFVNLTRRGGNQ